MIKFQVAVQEAMPGILVVVAFIGWVLVSAASL